MSLLEIQAIRALPTDYVKDGTYIGLVNGRVVACHEDLPYSIIYKDGEWVRFMGELWNAMVAENQKRAATPDSA